jgi:predicted lipase
MEFPERTHYFENDFGAEAALYTHLEGVVVTFRGTEIMDTQDMLADLRVLPTRPWKGSRLYVHRGFSSHVTSLWASLLPYVTKTSRTIYVCGHSLGGSMAQLFALRLVHEYPQIRNVILVTFGQPRTLYSKMPRSDRLTYIRVVDPEDPIPHYPPRLWGFRHGGKLVHVGTMVGHKRSWTGRMCICHFRLRDHSIRNYIESLSSS